MVVAGYSDELSVVDKMNILMRHTMIHSHIYYLLNSSVVTDEKYDEITSLLAELIQEHPEEFKETNLYEEFKDFDGSTGYHLVDEESEWAYRAQYVLDSYNYSNSKKGKS